MLNASSNAPAPAAHPAPAPAPAPQAPAKTVTWGPLAAVLVTVGGYFAANTIASILIMLVPQLFGWSPERVESWITSAVSAQFFFILMVEAVTLGLLWWFIRYRKGNLGMIGLGRGPRWSDVGHAILGIFVYFGAFIVVAMLTQALLPVDVDQKQELGFETHGQPFGALALIFVSLVVLPPIAEEVLFRGFLFSGMRRGFGVGLTVLLSSLLFGAAHLLTGASGEGLLWIAGIDTFVLALVLCYLRLRTNALWAPIFVHAAKNSVAFVSLFILHLA